MTNYRNQIRRFNKKMARIFPTPNLGFLYKSYTIFRKDSPKTASLKVGINYFEMFLKKQKLNFELLTWGTTILLFFSLLIKTMTQIQKTDVIGISKRVTNICEKQDFLAQTKICEIIPIFYGFSQGEHNNFTRQACQKENKLQLSDNLCKKIKSQDSYSYSFEVNLYNSLLQGNYTALMISINRDTISDKQLKYLKFVYQIYCILGGKEDITVKFIQSFKIQNNYINKFLTYLIIGIQRYAILPQIICNWIRKQLKLI